MNEPRNGWHLREVWFEDGEPTMHREPSKPEPVAWMYEQEAVRTERGVGGWDRKLLFCEPAHEEFKRNITPLYTAAPQRTWIDPSSAEIKALWNATKKPSEFAALLLAKFKEKNS